MNIIIKNVTGCPGNDWKIFELKRCGFPAGSIVRDVYFRPENNSCTWSSGADDCVAYLGETCEEVTPQAARISLEHIYQCKDGFMIGAFVDGKEVAPVSISREDVLSYTDLKALAAKFLITPNT